MSRGTDKKSDGDTSQKTGNAKSVELRRGGSLSLELEVDLMELEGDDRKFVFELIDKINEYKASVRAEAEAKEKEEAEAKEKAAKPAAG